MTGRSQARRLRILEWERVSSRPEILFEVRIRSGRAGPSQQQRCRMVLDSGWVPTSKLATAMLSISSSASLPADRSPAPY